MIKTMLNYLTKDIWFYVLAFLAVAFLIASFIVPPLGIIDSSVLLATSELFAWGVLGTVIKAINMGLDAKVKHGDTTLLVGDLNNKEDEEDE